MQSHRRLTRTIRGSTAACGVAAILGADTIAFAQETLRTPTVTPSNNAFGR